ncbi:hypothetical protein BCR32DRAFT_271108 [Anaeromyces robustus]|uniref:RGS domain-containing protein n=1 Tax=Anaeromyces robustus TaxID=1754192 RepID=A0A1Y1WT53_9FUNG|nr:hypothetical protein BCR32DRAFT_271108 [Anaeromyces robustus]|eukprot:ORX76717.1 hypothetical protein BCR32DRAFT_271108 [Anaeromyces robustus]
MNTNIPTGESIGGSTPNSSPYGNGGPTTITGGPFNGTIGGPPPVALADKNYIPNLTVEYSIFIFMFIYFVPTTILYFIYRNHIIIKYRQPKSVFAGAILSGVNSMLMPIFRISKIRCIVNTWIVSGMIFGFVIITFSRYIRTYYKSRLSIFKLKFTRKYGNSNNRSETSSMRINGALRKNDFSDNSLSSHKIIESNEIRRNSISMERSISKYSSFLKGSHTFSEMNSLENFDITDPILYFKKLNSIINQKITIYLIILPFIVLFIYFFIITIHYWSSMTIPCVNELRVISYPKLASNIIIVLSSFYLFYQAYYVQKWDKEIKIEYTVVVISDIFSTLLMQLIVHGVKNLTVLKYRVYAFQGFSLSIHAFCVITPLIKIYLRKYKKPEETLTKEEFLAKLDNSTFKAHVRDISTHTFCIENLLFFEAHKDLMNIVIHHYTKKASALNIDYSIHPPNSNIVSKNALNAILYKPFDPYFKHHYEHIYNLYIKEDSIGRVNVESSTLRMIEEQMENDNYSYLMFMPVNPIFHINVIVIVFVFVIVIVFEFENINEIILFEFINEFVILNYIF